MSSVFFWNKKMLDFRSLFSRSLRHKQCYDFSLHVIISACYLARTICDRIWLTDPGCSIEADCHRVDIAGPSSCCNRWIAHRDWLCSSRSYGEMYAERYPDWWLPISLNIIRAHCCEIGNIDVSPPILLSEITTVVALARGAKGSWRFYCLSLLRSAPSLCRLAAAQWDAKKFSIRILGRHNILRLD